MKSLHDLTKFHKIGGGGGGGGSSAPAAAPTPAPPPASLSAAEATQARLDAAQQAKRKKGITATLMQGTGADQTASAQQPTQPAKGNVLLGGGLMSFDYLGA